MSNWKLYWVKVEFEPHENCFVVAKNARSARSVEYKQWGERYEDISAEYVLTIPQCMEEEIIGKYKAIIQKLIENPGTNDEVRNLKNKMSNINSVNDLWPDYVDNRPISGGSWLLKQLGAQRYFQDKYFVTKIHGCEYTSPPMQEWIREVFRAAGRQPKGTSEGNITSVRDFRKKVAKLRSSSPSPGTLIYRGQRDAFWSLESGISRYESDHFLSAPKRKLYEKKLFQQFKLKALPYIEGQILPKTDWEWLIIGQHYGLPTMLLDWSKNPLCALYFSVRGNHGDRDGFVYAYRHTTPPFDMKKHTNPMKLSHIELIEPPHVTPRVIAQDSVFTAEPASYRQDEIWKKNTIVGEWYVCASNIERIRSELNNLGINEDSLFPNLERLCCSLKGKTT